MYLYVHFLNLYCSCATGLTRVLGNWLQLFYRLSMHYTCHLQKVSTVNDGGALCIYCSQVYRSCQLLAFSYKTCCIGILYIVGAGDVWFSLNGTTYQNNSLVTLEDIGEGNDGLSCVTNPTDCCTHGNWFFPNGSRVRSAGAQRDFHRSRGQMVVLLQRRRGGVDGIYCCDLRDSMNVTQTIHIGVYTTGNGEWHSALLFSSTKFKCVHCLKIHQSLQFFGGTLYNFNH